MKKIIAFALLLCLTLTLVACSNHVVATYSSNWFKEGKFIASTQTYTYKVENVDGFKHSSYDFSKQPNSKVDVKYGVGEYTVTLEAKTDLPNEYKDYTTSYKGTFKGFYLLTTSFNIDVTYTYDNLSYTFNDTITSTCWFNETDYYLQPIYHQKNYNTTSLDKNYNIAHSAYTSTVKYVNENAELSIVNNDIKEKYPDSDKYSLVETSTVNQTVLYNDLAVLDNEELLFAVRCLPLQKDYAVSLNVLDTTHRNVKSVAVRVLGEETVNTDLFKNNNFIVDGAPIVKDEATVNTFVTSIVLNEKLAGAPKFCYYQKGVKGSTDRALLVKFVDKLPNGLGALQYTLTSVNLGK
ncbi:MAG: hypothetical protein E7342_01640 [Clostridiales bacterium]|nr:hypothetical protein [Clostridiales bacterium]